MYYIRAFVESLIHRSWIVSQRKQIGKAIIYTVLLVSVFSLVSLITFGTMIQKDIRPQISDALEKIPDFNATVENGILSIENLEQPYQQESLSQQESALLYIDTNPSTTIDVVSVTDGYDFAMVVDEEQIQVLQSDGTSDGFFFREADDFELTDSDVKEFMQSLIFGKIFFVVAIVLFCMMTLALTLGALIWTMFFSLFILITAKIMKISLSYIDIVVMGLFARTWLFILDLFRLIPVYPKEVISILPTVDILLWLAIMIGVLFQYKNTIQTNDEQDSSYSTKQ